MFGVSETILKRLKKMGWTFHEINSQSVQAVAETAYGHPYTVDIEYDGTVENFISKFCDAAENFDIDHYLDLIAPDRGKADFPPTYVEMLDEADNLQKSFIEAADFLEDTDMSGDERNSIQAEVDSLSPEALELAYRKKELEYRTEDIMNHAEDYLMDDYFANIDFTHDVAESLAREFLETYDCNVTENDQMDDLIYEYLKEMKEESV